MGPEGKMVFHLRNATYLLDITNLLPHHYHLYPFHFVLFKDLVAKQHPTTSLTVDVNDNEKEHIV